jgi:hypothetical protein
VLRIYPNSFQGYNRILGHVWKYFHKGKSGYETHGSPVGRHCYLLTFLWLHIVASDVGPESCWAKCCTANVNGDVKATEIAKCFGIFKWVLCFSCCIRNSQ